MKAALLLLAATVGSTGCAENDLVLSITQMAAVTRATNCVASAMVGGVGRDRGLLDVALVTTSGYIAAPVVRNDLLSNLTGTSPERNRVTLIGANVTLLQPTGAPATVPSGVQKFFYAAASGQIDPASSASMFVEVLPKAAAVALTPSIPANGLLTVIAQVRPVGTRAGDQIIGGATSFPVDLCNNCLRTTSTCPLPVGTMTTASGCFPQQDDASLCCTDATSGAVLCGTSAPVKTM